MVADPDGNREEKLSPGVEMNESAGESSNPTSGDCCWKSMVVMCVVMSKCGKLLGLFCCGNSLGAASSDLGVFNCAWYSRQRS